ncbi:MAG TPA: hypothetical protein PKW35_24115, partial [Nannocystaceae bacterium]|nr:hypothetical protein [Nannocystaceae bacterium]
QAIRRLAEDGWIDLDEHIPNEARGIGLTAAGRLLLANWQLAEDLTRTNSPAIRTADPPTDPRPAHQRAAEFAALAWKIASGNRLRVVLEDDDPTKIDLVVLRDPHPHAPAFPSLVDQHLVWLVLDVATPDEPLLTQTITRRAAITTTIHQHHGEAALRRHANLIADATRRALHDPPLPDLRDIDAGRGAWTEAARLAATTACRWCHYRLGSNLDCPACKATLRRDPSAAWSTPTIAAALHGAIDYFGDSFDRQAAEAARRALAPFTELALLTHAFFDEWAARFAWHTADLFAAPTHRQRARERIEALMLEPWFALPKHEPARTLALPPTPTPAELAAQLRTLRKRLDTDGIPRVEAHRRFRTHECIRRLVAAIADLYGPDAHLAGDLLAPAIVIYRGKDPVIRHTTTLLGERTFAAPDLPSADRHAIDRRLADLRASLVDAVTAEHACLRTPDDDANAIDRAHKRLRAPTTPPTAAPSTTAIAHTSAPAPTTSTTPAPTTASALTTLALTPEQRLWLLDLLAGFVEDHDANHDDTDPTPPPPNVEWARALADQLSAEIAA